MTESGIRPNATINHSKDASWFSGTGNRTQRQMDTGSAARFFYCAKASKQDRDEGCEGLEPQRPHPPGNKWAETSIWNGENGDDEWRKPAHDFSRPASDAGRQMFCGRPAATILASAHSGIQTRRRTWKGPTPGSCSVVPRAMCGSWRDRRVTAPGSRDPPTSGKSPAPARPEPEVHLPSR